MSNISKPLVVGPAKRFSLLISVLNTLLRRNADRHFRSPGQMVLDRAIELASFYVTHSYRAVFARFGIAARPGLQRRVSPADRRP